MQDYFKIYFVLFILFILYFYFKRRTLVISHSAGFFSCCSVKLDKIVKHFNFYGTLPSSVDSSKQFQLYDIKDSFFDENFLSNQKYKEKIKFSHKHQFSNYKLIDHKNLKFFIEKYFKPSNEILEIVKKIETKYNINYNKLCTLFFRGNDKLTETKLPSYSKYVEKGTEFIKDYQFLIQTDELEFMQEMEKSFPNSIIFKDEIRVIPKQNTSVDIVYSKKENNKYAKFFLAITLIMSKSKIVICGSGNCDLWINLYRGNSTNVYQL